MASIVIADDHQVVRHGLRLLLELESDFRTVGEAADGLEALRLVELKAPDVLLLDLMMPALHGLEVIRHLKRRKTRTKILVLSMKSDEASIGDAFHCGADGYLTKAMGSDQLILAIRKICYGGSYFSSMPKQRRTCADIYETVSLRERTILQMMAEGNSSPQIAARLFISPRTVETHRKNIMQKLDLHSQTDLVRFAIRRKIIQP
jgi:DNA-binding NarL/FixJ family response regulator